MADAKTKADKATETKSTGAEVVELENSIEIQNDRVSGDQQDQDATEETEAETPAANIERIADASLPSREEMAAKLDREAKRAAKKG